MQGQGTKFVTTGPAEFAVTLDVQTNVHAMDDNNWRNVKAGRSANAVDSVHATRSPVILRVPRAGSWWIVVESVPGRSVRFGITAA